MNNTKTSKETLKLLEEEISQLTQEGRNVTEKIKKKLEQLKREGSLDEMETFYDSLEKLDKRSNYPYEEPSEIEEIRNKTPEIEIAFPKILDKDALYDHIYGAWLGRCIGCLLGKPVEGWPRRKIETYLKATNSYPLQDYFPYPTDDIDKKKFDLTEDIINRKMAPCAKNKIKYMARDDDLDYTILNLKLIEKKGFEFTSEDVGRFWLSNLPYGMVATAEHRAYANLVNDLEPPATAIYRNPFREWIGAQIRADIFGYLAPGNPELAASLAYKDACLSHTKNGIYGEIFITAVLSAALVSDDLEKVIDAGLSQVPENSRLAEVTKSVINWSKKANNWQEVWQKVMEQYGEYHRVHTLPNLAFVLLGLIWGELDFRKSISIAVMCGHDTDCNGATAGSILGALKGTRGIPKEMSEPLNDRIKSAVFGYSDVKISDLARRTFELALNK